MSQPVVLVVGHYCPTDANPETDIDGELGKLDDKIRAVVAADRADAESMLLWYPDGLIVEASP